MKRLLLFAALLLSTGLSSCQCASKPDVGPVEEGDERASRSIQVEEASPFHL